METNELIRALASDARLRTASSSSVWWGAIGLAIALAAAVFFATLGARPDFATAAETSRFLFKFVVTVTLAVSAFPLVRELSRPDETSARPLLYLAAAPALIMIAVFVELSLLPQEAWSASLVGSNSTMCLTYIPLTGIGPLAIFLLATPRPRDRSLLVRSQGCWPAVSQPLSTPRIARTIPRSSSPLGTRLRSPALLSLEPPARIDLRAGSIRERACS